MKKAGLYFGTFDPVHKGHLGVAKYLINHSDCDEIWFIPTPQSTHKLGKSISSMSHRLAMLNIATSANPSIIVKDVESAMSPPYFTYDTMTYLKNSNTTYSFALIMGADNFVAFSSWKNYKELLDSFPVYVYPRGENKANKTALFTHQNVHYIDNAPRINVSASFVRAQIQKADTLSPLLPSGVFEYILREKLYNG